MLNHFARKASACIALLMATVGLTPQPVKAEARWRPGHAVTIVVPYAAGGGTDATARAVAKQLAVLWKQPVVVENAPGADGSIGTQRVIGAKPDGYTLLLQVPSIVLVKFTPGFRGIDPLSKLDPVTAISQAPNAIVVSGKLPVKSFSDFIRFCKVARPPCSLASGDSLSRVFARQLAAETGLPDVVVVNYKGTASIVSDMIANMVNMSFTGINASLPHHKNGTMKILATMGERRAASLPDVPTTAEAGFPQFQSVSWFGLFAPKGIPRAVSDGIVATLKEAVRDSEVRAALASAAAEPIVNSPSEFAAQVRVENDRLGVLMRKYPND